MTAISAAMVKVLREKTDAPMMECKKALTEANGDMEKAEEILRVKLGNKATKAAARVTAEGIVAIYITENRQVGAMLEVNCETDFVAKNPDFLNMVNQAAQLIVDKNPKDIEALSALSVNGQTLEQIRTELVGKIGENMTFRRFERLEAKGKLYQYIHGGKIGTLIDLQDGDEALGKDLAMHIAASKPKALDASRVDAQLIEKERRVAIEKAREAGKPEAIVEKIAEGSVQKFLKDVTLLGQVFVKATDGETVEKLLKSHKAAVNHFALYIVGEGIEKKVVDFASEVAAQQAAARK